MLGFEWYEARSSNPDGTILALEGGPGGSATAARDGFLLLFSELTDQHNLLLVDVRGTGRSEPIDCEELEDYYLGGPVSIDRAVTECATKLDTTWKDDDGSYRTASTLFSTENAADDLDRVLESLELDSVHVFGSSYGTLLARGFATRCPERIASLTLDSPYVVESEDGYRTDTVAAFMEARRGRVRGQSAAGRGCGVDGGRRCRPALVRDRRVRRRSARRDLSHRRVRR